jgi:hypothetical protein
VVLIIIISQDTTTEEKERGKKMRNVPGPPQLNMQEPFPRANFRVTLIKDKVLQQVHHALRVVL